MRRAAAVSFLATALLAGAAPSAASPAPTEKLDPPTLLWKSFPLVQQEASQARTARAPAVPQAFAQQDSGRIGQSYLLVLTLLLLTAMLLAAAAVAVTRTSAPARVRVLRGGVGRTRRRRMVRAVAAPGPRATAPVTRARRPPPHLRVVSPRPIPPPPRPQIDPVGAKPEDDLTEAPPAVPSPEAVPDVPLEIELLRLVERIDAAAERERDELRKQVADISARIDAQPPTERELERRREHELRLLADAVERRAEPGFEPPPVPDVARAPRPAGEALVTCEIRLWRSFTRCQLYATAGYLDEAFALSGFFRLREAEAPNEKALRALSDFLARLARHGWTVVATGPTWYQHRLERPAPPPPPSL